MSKLLLLSEAAMQRLNDSLRRMRLISTRTVRCIETSQGTIIAANVPGIAGIVGFPSGPGGGGGGPGPGPGPGPDPSDSSSSSASSSSSHSSSSGSGSESPSSSSSPSWSESESPSSSSSSSGSGSGSESPSASSAPSGSSAGESDISSSHMAMMTPFGLHFFDDGGATDEAEAPGKLAIVPIPGEDGGTEHIGWFCVERPRAMFEEVFTVRARRVPGGGYRGHLPLPREFTESVEPRSSLATNAMVRLAAIPATAEVIGDVLFAEAADGPDEEIDVLVTVEAPRRHMPARWPRFTPEEAARNNAFWARAFGGASPDHSAHCQFCGEKITEPSVHIENRFWQCPECHHMEHGSWPWGDALSMPDPEN